jgi:large subunit ribosomal protein L25
VLNVVRREVEVMADVDAVPEGFVIDLAEATIGDSLRWSAVKDTQRAKPVIVGRDFVVATIAPPTVIEEEVAPAAAPAAPEATKQKKPAAAAPAAAAKPAAKKK